MSSITGSDTPTVFSFAAMKAKARKIVMATAYDFAMASSLKDTGIDVILVGDSLGMVVLGYENTLSVTMEDMIYHTQAVRRGALQSFIITDMPYLSYHLSLDDTKLNAARLVTSGKADAVKLEGGSPSRLDAIKAIIDIEIPVCGHIGLTPQSVHKIGGYKVQGKTEADFERILKEAIDIEQAGAFMIVLEGMPEALGKKITESVSIPTIGIGAGRYCDGQVLVYHDLLGMSDFIPKFAKKYTELNNVIASAVSQYSREVKEGVFPAKEQVYYPID